MAAGKAKPISASSNKKPTETLEKLARRANAEVQHSISQVKAIMQDGFAQHKAWRAEAERLLLGVDGQNDPYEIRQYIRDNPPSPEAIAYLVFAAQEKFRQENAKKGGDAKAAKLEMPTENLRQAWASGKYENRDVCAEQEYSGLGFSSFKTARNKLIGTPDPSPWPAKKMK
jgi:hypothetical protein